jgi:hypothetical protein
MQQYPKNNFYVSTGLQRCLIIDTLSKNTCIFGYRIEIAGAEGREKKCTQNFSQEIYYGIPLWVPTRSFKNHIKIIDR